MTRLLIPKEFLGAFRRGHREASKEFIDEGLSYALLKRVLDSGYKDREAVELLSYITKFNNEYHKNVVKKGDKKALHNTDKLRKECYARENARNRDIMSVRKHLKIHVDQIEKISDTQLILITEDTDLSFYKTVEKPRK